MSRPATTNPVAYTYAAPESAKSGSTAHSIPHPEPISSTTHHIAGILTTVYGLAELDPSVTDVAVLWLLHPRLQTHECMAPFAAHIISDYSSRAGSGRRNDKKKLGLIAVAFDQRNHGSRLVMPIANEAWRGGNETHAQDMFSCFAGTAVDTSMLLDYLPAYIFPDGKKNIVQNMVLGISLGGHAAWHVVMQDPRFSAAVVTIGCPDYVRVMSDRARLSKRRTWLESQGRTFLGSPDFPNALVDKVRKVDPTGLLWHGSGLGRRSGQEPFYDGGEMTDRERETLMPVMARCFGNKRILNLSGGSDKLVGYQHSKPFLDWLKKSVERGGWFEGSGLYLEDIVYPGVGHEVPPDMVTDMVRFINETLEEGVEGARLGSKI
ncbi:uncharacterized protein PV06_04938 [Exophiala oligosperma]|uniref:AB hydrolase-1 domain-containing protein n=2 Tax=Chaetothyriales TaxID=34395 RepID=A0A0D2C2A1_9EURO|nr:uncharacterized protein PV06_04938 [Exophiala oligosperma]KAJ9638079.1 hypothetical protein H2204_004390 [Knufia peltigerae]KIW43882.1 hypothetical protein PV06_04938 [Exophiala oligosperma]